MRKVDVKGYFRKGNWVRPHTRRGPRRRTLGAIAIVLGGSVALGSGGTAAFEGASAHNPKPRSSQTAKSPIEVELRAVARWRSRGYQVEVKEHSQLGACDTTAYGDVKRFFRAHPCRSLHRFMADLRKPRGGNVVVAVSTVDMPDVDSADAFKDLVDIHGTGNVLELPKEFRAYRKVTFTGHRYRSWQDDNLVTNVQAEPVVGAKLGLFTITEILNLAA